MNLQFLRFSFCPNQDSEASVDEHMSHIYKRQGLSPSTAKSNGKTEQGSDFANSFIEIYKFKLTVIF